MIWGDGAAAAEYQWGLTGYSEAQARVVDTYVQRRGRAGNEWEPAEWSITWDRTLTESGFVESGQETPAT